SYDHGAWLDACDEKAGGANDSGASAPSNTRDDDFVAVLVSAAHSELELLTSLDSCLRRKHSERCELARRNKLCFVGFRCLLCNDVCVVRHLLRRVCRIPTAGACGTAPNTAAPAAGRTGSAAWCGRPRRWRRARGRSGGRSRRPGTAAAAPVRR